MSFIRPQVLYRLVGKKPSQCFPLEWTFRFNPCLEVVDFHNDVSSFSLAEKYWRRVFFKINTSFQFVYTVYPFATCLLLLRSKKYTVDFLSILIVRRTALYLQPGFGIWQFRWQVLENIVTKDYSKAYQSGCKADRMRLP